MPITFVKHFPFFRKNYEGIEPAHRILFFDPSMERQKMPLGDRFRTLDPTLRDADVVVLRGIDDQFLDRVTADSVFQRVARNTPIVILARASDGPTSPTLIRPAWSIEASVMPELDLLRHIEFVSIFERNGAVFGDNCHYVPPSSRFHTSLFVRVANSLGD